MSTQGHKIVPQVQEEEEEDSLYLKQISEQINSLHIEKLLIENLQIITGIEPSNQEPVFCSSAFQMPVTLF